jgi:hypothetical protein
MCVSPYDFSVGYEDLKQRYLQFTVYDFDRFSRHDLIGHVVLKGLLDSTDLHQELEFTMNVLCAPQVRHTYDLTLRPMYIIITTCSIRPALEECVIMPYLLFGNTC